MPEVAAQVFDKDGGGEVDRDEFRQILEWGGASERGRERACALLL